MSKWFLVVRHILLGVILPFLDTGFDIKNVYQFYERSDFWWSGFTLFFVCLPGLMEVFYWVICICIGGTSLKTAAYYSFVYGPFTFPISVPIRSAVLMIKDRSFMTKKYSQSMVFQSLEAFLESAPQLLLQTTILVIKWSYIWNHKWQLLSVLSSILFLSITSSEHHLHELSAKEVIPRLRDVLICSPFFFINALFRSFVFAVLISYLRWWSVLVIAGLIVFNFIASWLLFRTDRPKDVWTAVSSTLGLACFVSSNDIYRYRESLKKSSLPAVLFHRFFVVNTLFFTVALSSVFGGLVVLLKNYDASFTCEQLPVFSCANEQILQNRDNCPFRRSCGENEGPHDFFISVIIPVCGTILAAHLVIVLALRYICPSLMPNHPIQRRI